MAGEVPFFRGRETGRGREAVRKNRWIEANHALHSITNSVEVDPFHGSYPQKYISYSRTICCALLKFSNVEICHYIGFKKAGGNCIKTISSSLICTFRNHLHVASKYKVYISSRKFLWHMWHISRNTRRSLDFPSIFRRIQNRKMVTLGYCSILPDFTRPYSIKALSNY